MWPWTAGGIDKEEMFRTFNMGVGMVVAAAPQHAERTLEMLPGAFLLGKVAEGNGVVIE